jgi:2-dehydro-3-deoxyphosphooctonate aldolase (KDO 8-P synthase)
VLSDSQLWKTLSNPRRFVLIAGPCVIESEDLCFEIARTLKRLAKRHDCALVFKASYDKANRSSANSFRGTGVEAGLETLAKIRRDEKLPVLTDVHGPEQAEIAGKVVDVLQIPAFLCRQTDLIQAAAQTGKIVNIKKGQFLSPREMGSVVKKAEAAGGKKIMLTERGTTFGYNNLVADMRSIPIMAGFGYPVIFDATHSVQLPGGAGDRSSGQREFAPVLARAALASGANGLFLETHPDPEKALSDGPNMIPLAAMSRLLGEFLAVHQLARNFSRL